MIKPQLSPVPGKDEKQMVDKKLIIQILRNQGLIKGATVKFKALEGGVSSDIYLASDGERKVVIKQALPKLQVEDEWYADVARNKTEQAFIRFLQSIRPQAVTKLLYSDQEHAFFAMEYLGDTFNNWKQQMLRGIFKNEIARKAAKLLADIHIASEDNTVLEKRFNTTPGFKSLRVEPYLMTTGKRHPTLQPFFFKEAHRLVQHRQSLVHGDFSPKNIMTNSRRLVVLDHEVAWYGDPAFDVAFLLNHLYLKMLFHYQSNDTIQDLTGIFWDNYWTRMGLDRLRKMELRIGRLLLMLMLARVDGKSPVEYLNEDGKEFIRSFVYEQLPNQIFEQVKINANWKAKLKSAQI